MRCKGCGGSVAVNDAAAELGYHVRCLDFNKKEEERIMNRYIARRIAEEITFDEIITMLENAKAGIKDWAQRSIVNKAFDKGTAWNHLANPEAIDQLKTGGMKRTAVLYKTNLILEFGAFLPDHLKPKKSKSLPEPIHNTPNLNWSWK